MSKSELAEKTSAESAAAAVAPAAQPPENKKEI